MLSFKKLLESTFNENFHDSLYGKYKISIGDIVQAL